jgi:hypothetical protein
MAVYLETYNAIFLEEQVLTLQAEHFFHLLLKVYIVLRRFQLNISFFTFVVLSYLRIPRANFSLLTAVFMKILWDTKL